MTADRSLAVVDVPAPHAPLAREPVLGVPLLLWSLRPLRAIPELAPRVRSDDPAVLAIAERAGLAPAGSGTTPALVATPTRPFCAAETARRAFEAGTRELAAVQTSAIERVAVEDAASLELARAVARGLDPAHPAIVGIHAQRLPPGARIRAVVCDVDGTLTDGGIQCTGAGEPTRRFATRDGLAAKGLVAAGIEVALLSATSRGASTRERAAMLGLEHVDVGPGAKGPRFETLCRAIGVAPAEVLYVGDDDNDLPAMALAGVSACPADASAPVRAAADLPLLAPGGGGVLREIAELLGVGAAGAIL